MHLEVWQEQVSKAYVRAVVAAAGPNYKVVDGETPDSRCVDIAVAFEGTRPPGWRAGADLHIQLKSTRRPVYRDGHLCYPVDRRLVYYLTESRYIPLILIVVVVPDDPVNTACSWTPAGITVAECGYWFQSNDIEMPEGQATMTLRIPLTQRFGPDAVAEWMRLAATVGEWGRR